MERFTIQDTVRNFADWANEYGEDHQWNFIRREVFDKNLLHTVGPRDRNVNWGEINFHIERNGGVLHITAEASKGDNPVTPELLGYFREMAAAIRERWPQASLSLVVPSDPATWVKALIERGVENGSEEWWAIIEHWVRDHRRRNGQRSLPIKSKLAPALGVSKSTIYAKTGLGEKSGQ